MLSQFTSRLQLCQRQHRHRLLLHSLPPESLGVPTTDGPLRDYLTLSRTVTGYQIASFAEDETVLTSMSSSIELLAGSTSIIASLFVASG